MNAAGTAVMKELPDIECAYGISDEFRYGRLMDVFADTDCSFSFIFDRSSRLFERRER